MLELFRERILAVLCIMCFMGIGALVGKYFGQVTEGTTIGILIGVLFAIYLVLVSSKNPTKKREALIPDKRHRSRRKRKNKQHR